MSKKILIEIDEERFNRILIELNSSREQLLDCDENEWSEEVAELEDYLRNLERKEIGILSREESHSQWRSFFLEVSPSQETESTSTSSIPKRKRPESTF